MEKCPNGDVIATFRWAIDRVEQIAAEEEQRDDLSSVAQLALNQLQTEMVDKSVRVARTYGCAICGSMEVDLSSGHLYCGRDAPIEILKSNARIENN